MASAQPKRTMPVNKGNRGYKKTSVQCGTSEIGKQRTTSRPTWNSTRIKFKTSTHGHMARPKHRKRKRQREKENETERKNSPNFFTMTCFMCLRVHKLTTQLMLRPTASVFVHCHVFRRTWQC